MDYLYTILVIIALFSIAIALADNVIEKIILDKITIPRTIRNIKQINKKMHKVKEEMTEINVKLYELENKGLEEKIIFKERYEELKKALYKLHKKELDYIVKQKLKQCDIYGVNSYINYKRWV